MKDLKINLKGSKLSDVVAKTTSKTIHGKPSAKKPSNVVHNLLGK